MELVDSVKSYKVEQLFKLFDTNQDGKIDFKVGNGFLAGLIVYPAAWTVLPHGMWYRLLNVRACLSSSSCTAGHCQECVSSGTAAVLWAVVLDSLTLHALL